MLAVWVPEGCDSMKAMVGAGFVKLCVGDAIQHGDEYFDANTGEWEPSKCAGKHAVGKPNCTSSIYRRRCHTCSNMKDEAEK